MDSQHTHIQINDTKTKWIEPILDQWVRLHEEYINENKSTDCLYWYNERANVSAFAGAVWKSGGFALEEYSSLKGSEEDRANGRVDLYFSKNNHKAIAEAKMEWLYFSDRTRLGLQEKIDRVTKRSNSDIVNSLQANSYELGLGLSFITTYWRKDYKSEKSMNSLREFMKSYSCAFHAIFESKTDITSSKGNVCNSVILVGTAHHS